MSKELKLGEIARLVGGRLVGDPALCVKGAAIIRDATSDDITLADRATLFDELSASSAAAVIVPDGLQPSGIAYIQVRDVRAAFAELVMLFRPHTLREAQGISPFARIESSTVLGENVNIHAGATVGADVVIGDGSTIHAGAVILAGCRIGRNVTIFPNAVLYENTIVGDRCRVHAGAVIGAFGFGYETKDGQHLLSAQLGYVEIGDDVDIGACTTIDRGTYGATIVGSGTKIDNQVMIGHNCRIGKGNIICSQVGIAGSCTTGD
ncbi:MAG: UDP-3-O-(3-hydroxymyristoyl)glucosamine N-acyltransferase, partial [Planctomycetales bacterium]|nr:UDP-3-O-(3-hydroxymyristoyl)glucosamine N-acyltransferase [Planctomycetales bacterium]